MIAEAEKFDAEVIGFAVGDIEFENGGVHFWLTSPSKGRLEYFHPAVFHALNLQEFLREGDTAEDVRAWCEQTLSQCEPETIELLRNRRLRMSILVDSRGGRGIIASWVIRGMDRIRRNGGITRAFALEKAHSAAGLIWRAADQRFITPGTRSTWHAPRTADGIVEKQLVEPVKEETIEYLTSTATASQTRDRAIAAVKASDDATVRFNATELQALGLVHGVHDGYFSVGMQLVRDLGVSIGDIRNLLRIRSLSCALESDGDGQ